MRKKLLLSLGLLLSLSAVSAQDTLIYQNFNDTFVVSIYNDYPSGNVGDTNWYDYDQDGIADGSPNGNRPLEWFRSYATITDSILHGVSLASSSWTNSTNPPIANWFVTRSIQITDTSAVVSWLSAPSQTPYYCDGYVVLVSTTDNNLPSFTDTLFIAAEYTSGAFSGGGNYNNYTFSEGFIHGIDSTFIEFNVDGDGNAADTTAADSARFNGLLRPFSASLAAYDNMQIYIAWLHNSHDDNILFIDDVLVTETTDVFFAVDNLPDFVGSVYPNPATNFVNVNIDISQYHNAHVEMINSSGQLVYNAALTTVQHKINLQNIANGVYYIKIIANEGSMVEKVIVTQ